MVDVSNHIPLGGGVVVFNHLNIVEFELGDQDALDELERGNRWECHLSGHKAVVDDNKILVQEVFDPDLQYFVRLEHQLVIFFYVVEFAIEAGGVHLLWEELDVVDRAYHVVGDRRVQHFHHVVLLSFFLELQVLSDVAE